MRRVGRAHDLVSAVRAALIGFGYWGQNLARNIKAAHNLELVVVADVDQSRRDAATAAVGAQGAASLDEVLARDDVDAVVLATPASMHESDAIRVLESGRDVLVEKPLAMSTTGAERVVAAADETGRIAMVGHTFLYSAPVAHLRASIEAGELGKIQYIYSQRLSLGRIRTDCNALWNFAPHDVSILLHLLDEEPVAVAAQGLSFLTDDVSDVFFATLRFASGVAANLHVSWIDPRKVRLMTVVGDKKMAVYDDVAVEQKITMHDAGVAGPTGPDLGAFRSMAEFQWTVRAGDITIPKLQLREPLLAEMEAFGEACLSREPPLTDARHGLAVVRVLEAIQRSADLGGASQEIKR